MTRYGVKECGVTRDVYDRPSSGPSRTLTKNFFVKVFRQKMKTEKLGTTGWWWSCLTGSSFGS